MDFSLDSWQADFANYGMWEIPAVLAALIYVILAARRNRWCFLYGFISSAIYIYLSFHLKLYFDTFINAYYVAMSVYGWIDWTKEDVENDAKVLRIGWKKFSYYSIGIVALSFILGSLAENFTDNSLPYWDSFTTLGSLLATYWVVKRYIENWIIWVLVDLVYVFVYLAKGLPLTSVLFFSYTFMAIFGYFNWNTLWKAKSA
ncbi:MAG: hypothetical protein CMP59_12890 [Flavobacteriales bacterium]|nr:hypothetical protein [Flavobacteriales bacterium]